MKAFSIHDRLNFFGKITNADTVPGPLIETIEYAGEESGGIIYVGKGDQTPFDVAYGMIDTRRRSGDGEGGQLGMPFFAEFYIDAKGAETNKKDIVLKVQGFFFDEPATGATGYQASRYDRLDASGKVVIPNGGSNGEWKDVAIYTVPEGELAVGLQPKAAFSDSKYKHFRCYASWTKYAAGPPEVVGDDLEVRAFLHKDVE
jgi:hypothetical protein